MAVTDDYPRIIENNRKMTRPMHKLYKLIQTTYSYTLIPTTINYKYLCNVPQARIAYVSLNEVAIDTDQSVATLSFDY